MPHKKEFKTEVLAIDHDFLQNALYRRESLQLEGLNKEAADSIDAAAGEGKSKELKYVQFLDEGEKIAVLSIHGALDYRASGFIAWLFGLKSVERLTAEFNSLVKNSNVETIILDIDSPGGSVVGIAEFAEKIYQARGEKRIVAFSNPLAASAAFWIASAADEFVSMPSGYVGSVGVYRMHVDYSKKLEKDGIAVTFIKRGENKAEGNPYQPLSERSKKTFQSMIDEVYEAFIGALARNRGKSFEAIEADFGQGSMRTAKQALQKGMIDDILTLENLIDREVSLVYNKERDKAFLANAKNRLILEELK